MAILGDATVRTGLKEFAYSTLYKEYLGPRSVMIACFKDILFSFTLSAQNTQIRLRALAPCVPRDTVQGIR